MALPFVAPRVLAPFRPHASLADMPRQVLGRCGTLTIRLAGSRQDVRRAQRLRYQVFHEERGAAPDARCRFLRRDIDGFDAVCDHLIVEDTARLDLRPGRRPRPVVVGTYRLLRQERAGSSGFYSQGEFDVAALVARHPGKRFLELGRSCVLAEYRTRKTVELLWHGIWTYVRRHGIDVMFGCASLEGTDPAALRESLGFLHHHARAEGEWHARAHPSAHVPMDAVGAEAVDAKAALRALPPLLKGYLRLGARFGEGAVIDPQFGTTDVLVILPVTAIDPRYVDYYGADGERYAA
jgi:putative hemolysin